jgi:hypothetical protein
VFPGFTPDLAKKTMARACVTAGIAHRHPHDLRHRYERSTQLRDVLKQRQTPRMSDAKTPLQTTLSATPTSTISGGTVFHFSAAAYVAIVWFLVIVVGMARALFRA